MVEEIELANVSANDSDSKASQETANENGVTYGDSKVKIIRKVEPIVVDPTWLDRNGGSTQRKRRSFQGTELNEAVSTESEDLDESGTPSKSKIQDFEYPESVGRFWTRKNFCRLSCWTSFWLSLYYLYYALNEITHENSQSSNQNQSRSANLTEGNFINGVDPTAMLIFSLLYLAEMIFIGIVMHFNYRVDILIQESKLNSHIFTITFLLNLWIAVEIFLLFATILFVFYVNCGEFPCWNFLVLFRILPIIAGWVRLLQVNKAANSNNTDED